MEIDEEWQIGKRYVKMEKEDPFLHDIKQMKEEANIKKELVAI